MEEVVTEVPLAGFEDGGMGHEPQKGKGCPLEAGKGTGIHSPLELPERTSADTDFSPV